MDGMRPILLPNCPLLQVSEIAMTSDYGVADLRAELKDLYRKAGVKPALPLVFMLTDTQVKALRRCSARCVL